MLRRSHRTIKVPVPAQIRALPGIPGKVTVRATKSRKNRQTRTEAAERTINILPGLKVKVKVTARMETETVLALTSERR